MPSLLVMKELLSGLCMKIKFPILAKESVCEICNDIWDYGFERPCPKLRQFNETSKKREGRLECMWQHHPIVIQDYFLLQPLDSISIPAKLPEEASLTMC